MADPEFWKWETDYGESPEMGVWGKSPTPERFCIYCRRVPDANQPSDPLNPPMSCWTSWSRWESAEDAWPAIRPLWGSSQICRELHVALDSWAVACRRRRPLSARRSRRKPSRPTSAVDSHTQIISPGGPIKTTYFDLSEHWSTSMCLSYSYTLRFIDSTSKTLLRCIHTAVFGMAAHFHCNRSNCSTLSGDSGTIT